MAAAGGVAATGALGGNGSDAASAVPSGPPNTAKVVRTSLTRTETVDGGLGYGAATTVQAPAAAPGELQQPDGQIITWLPAAGSTVKRGGAVYRVNERKVPLLYGAVPLYRTLAAGTVGKDVQMLESNLAALGYTGFTADDTYTQGTADAVRSWQEDLGRPETGTAGPGDAVVASGAKRVAEVKSSAGAAFGGELLTWTGTERIVTVDLEVEFEDLVEKGTEATVELPDGSSVKADVAHVGTAATAVEAEGGEEEKATLPVELRIADQKKLGRYTAAAVNVHLRAETRKDVLGVPVNALVALKEGGYALETVGPQGIAYLPVELGMFAGGLVEVSGEGVEEGLVVGVPK